MKNEFYDITFRKKIYRTLDELQLDVDYWISQYNEQRPHSGKHCYGKTPLQTFIDAKPLAQEKQLDNLFQLSENVQAESGCEESSSNLAHIEINKNLDLTDYKNVG